MNGSENICTITQMQKPTKPEMFLDKFAHKPVIIAEAGVNHNGDPALAIKLIEAAAAAGADIIKFQTFKACECAGKYADTAQYQKNSAFSNQYQLLKGLELPFDVFSHLKHLSEKLGLTFLSTPDGQMSLDLLCELNTAAIKIGSGELTNLPFLKTVGKKKRPVILSTGMGSLGEIQNAVETLTAAGTDEIILMHCTTEYPAPPESTNLLALKTMRQAFGLPVGFSDHTTGSEAAIAATANGAVIIEKHLTIDRQLPGPDHAASIEPHEFALLVASLRKTAMMMGTGTKQATLCEQQNLKLVRRSLVAARKMQAGEILTADKIAIKRPATGIAPELLPHAANRILLSDLAEDEPVTWAHLGEVMNIEP